MQSWCWWGRGFGIAMGVVLGLAGPQCAHALDGAFKESDAKQQEVKNRVEVILSNLKETRYVHRKGEKKEDSRLMDESQGIYRYDCSGFVGMFVLKEIAPAHCSQLNGKECSDDQGGRRPLAETFHDFALLQPSVGSAECVDSAWCRVVDMRTAQAGDIIAAKYSQSYRGLERSDGNTGHVMILWASLPDEIKDMAAGEVAVEVADSASSPHGNDSRSGSAAETGKQVSTGCQETPSRCGIGKGTMYFGFDDQGSPTYYRWSSPEGMPITLTGNPMGLTGEIDAKLKGIAILRANNLSSSSAQVESDRDFSWFPLYLPANLLKDRRAESAPPAGCDEASGGPCPSAEQH